MRSREVKGASNSGYSKGDYFRSFRNNEQRVPVYYLLTLHNLRAEQRRSAVLALDTRALMIVGTAPVYLGSVGLSNAASRSSRLTSRRIVSTRG
jgi:hypothetical protein